MTGPCRAGWALLFLAVTGCSPKLPSDAWQGWEEVPVRHAEYFQLRQQGDARLLITFGPGGTGDTTGLFMVGKGEGGPAGSVRLEQPVSRVALLSTTHASFISALGHATDVVGCAHVGRLRDPAVKALADAGKITEIGTAEGVDREKVLMLAPGALFVYPYGGEANLTAMGGLPVIPVAEYLERDPLGRAEWIKVFGLLLGEEDKAAGLFDDIVGRYGQAKAAVPPAQAERPGVFFGSSWKGTWSVPSGRSYMARLIGDAGGQYLFADREAPGNIDLGLEQVLQVGMQAAFWGRIMDQERPVAATDVAGDDGRILDLPAFRQHGAFFANSRESDIFGKAGLEPDVVLTDLIQLFHPERAGDREPVYFRSAQ